MEIFACFKNLIPTVHAYQDADQRYNVGATWTSTDGLQDYHNLELKYVCNSERLALQGDVQPDGSWVYVEPNGCVHTIAPDRAKHFMEKTHEHATIMCAMIDKLRDAGVMDNILDADAQAA